MKVLRSLLSLGMAAAILLPFPVLNGQAFATAEPSTAPLVERYRQALDADPENQSLRYSLGVALLLDARPEEAVPEFRGAYASFADSIEMNYLLGVALTRTGDADSACLYLEQAEALGALRQAEIYSLPSAYYNVGLLYHEAGQTRESLRIFNKVLKLDPGRTEIYRLLGEIHARKNSHDKAIESFRAYLQLYPEDAEALESLFAIYFNNALKALEKDRLDNARNDFTKALEVSPGSPVATYYLGFIAYQQEDWLKTVRNLAGPYADYPEDLRRAARPLLYNAALALHRDGLPAPALEAVTALLRRHPKEIRVLYLAGNIHLALSEFIEAQRFYERVLKLESGHRGAALNLVAARGGAFEELISRAQSSLRREAYRDAWQFCRQALEIDPTDPKARTFYAEVERELDATLRRNLADADAALDAHRFQDAMIAAIRGLELRPESAEAGKLLEKARAGVREEFDRRLRQARTALERGELGPAAEGFAAILSLDPGNSAARQGLDAVRAARRERASSLSDEGKAYLGKGQLGKARDAFRASLALLPDHSAALDGLHQVEALVSSMFAEEVKWARRAVNKGRLGTAEGHYRKALDLRDDAAVRIEKAELEKKRRQRLENVLSAARHAQAGGDFRRAMWLVRRALEEAPDSQAARQALSDVGAAAAVAVREILVSAAAALEADETGLALAHYRKVLDIDPANKVALEGLKSVQESRASRIDRLVSQAEKAFSEGRMDRARALAGQVLALDPWSAAARRVSKRVDAAGSRPRQDMAEVDGDDLYSEGLVFYARGLYTEAVAAWEELLSVDPGLDKARRGIEKTRRKLERTREARNG